MKKMKWRYSSKFCIYDDVNITKKELKKIVKDELKDLKKHFKENGWNIDINSLQENILYRIFGFHLSETIKGELCKIEDVFIEFRAENNLYRSLAVKENRVTAIYDEYKNKMLLIEGDYDVMNYRELDGYVFLGVL